MHNSQRGPHFCLPSKRLASCCSAADGEDERRDGCGEKRGTKGTRDPFLDHIISQHWRERSSFSAVGRKEKGKAALE